MSELTDQKLHGVKQTVSRLRAGVPGLEMRYRVERDCQRPVDGRIFVQCVYDAPCTVTGNVKEWHGRKWYLSDYMTEDEVVKTCYAAFRAAVEHEVLEGFLCDGRRVFNPHTPYPVLMEAAEREEFRERAPD